MCNVSNVLQNFFYKLKIKHQVFVGIISIILINLVLITIIVSINVFLLSNSTYKDIINVLDNNEFDQLSYFGLSAENGNMHLNEMVRRIVSALGYFKGHLNNQDNLGLLDSAYIDSVYPDVVFHIDEFNESASTSSQAIVYFSPSKTLQDLKKDPSFQKELRIIKSLIPTIFASYYVNIFNFEPLEGMKRETFFENIVLVNYSLDVLFFFPTNSDKIKNINRKINLSNLKSYVKSKSNELVNMIELFESYDTHFVYNLQNYASIIYELPLFLERDIYSEFFLKDKVGIKILSSLNLYTQQYSTKEVNFTNYNDKFNETVVFLSSKSTADVLYDLLFRRVALTSLLIADFQYPYELYTSFQCAYLLYHNSYSLEDVNTPLQTLADCLNKTPRNTVTKKTSSFATVPFEGFSDKDEFFQNLDLFEDRPDFVISNSTSTKKIIREKELSVFKSFLQAHSASVNTRVNINNINYKAKKSYAPLTTDHFFEYEYPITSLSVNIVLKNEGFFNNNKKFLFMKAISNFIISFLASLFTSYVIVIFIVIHLFRVMELIDQPLKLINDAVQTISEKDKFNDAKQALEKYIYDTNNDEVIEEFVDLITIILDMIEGNMNLKQDLTQTNFIRLKMEEDKLNRNFELVKMNNLIVLEDRILDQVEKQNYFNEILKISFDRDILRDEKVRTCSTFMRIYERHRSNIKKSRIKHLKLPEMKFLTDNTQMSFIKFPFTSKPRKTSKKISIASAGALVYSSSDDSEQDDSIFEVEERIKNKVRKMLSIRDQLVVNKLRRTDNPLFSAFSHIIED